MMPATDMRSQLHSDERGSFRRIVNPVHDQGSFAAEMNAHRLSDCEIGSARRWLDQFASHWEAVGSEYWRSDLYLVQVTDAHAAGHAIPGVPAMLWLRIYRHDGREIEHHWRELQRIKNELVGLECQGVEFYPAASRLHDGENSYHLWVFTVPGEALPFGLFGPPPHAAGPDSPSSVPTRFVTDGSPR